MIIMVKYDEKKIADKLIGTFRYKHSGEEISWKKFTDHVPEDYKNMSKKMKKVMKLVYACWDNLPKNIQIQIEDMERQKNAEGIMDLLANFCE